MQFTCLHTIFKLSVDLKIIVIYITFTFSHLADAFISKRLTNEDNRSNQNQQNSNDICKCYNKSQLA